VPVPIDSTRDKVKQSWARKPEEVANRIHSIIARDMLDPPGV